MELRPEGVSLLERWLHFRECYRAQGVEKCLYMHMYTCVCCSEGP